MAISMPAAAGHRRLESRQRDHVFFSVMSVAAAMVVVVGFSRTYYLRTYFDGPALSPLRAVHGAVLSAWVLLAVAQPLLVAARRTAVHRRLGVLGAALAAAVVVNGVAMAITSAREGRAPPGIDPRAFLAIPLFELVAFTPLVAAGLYVRHRPEAHKRLMLLATVSILGAPSARLPGALATVGQPFFLVVDAFVVAVIVYDVVTRRRVHPASLWGGLLIVASQPVRFALSGTDAWLAFADLLVRR
jgi:hypothetical protein